MSLTSRAAKFLVEHLASSALSAAGQKLGEAVGERIGKRINPSPPEPVKDDKETA